MCPLKKRECSIILKRPWLVQKLFSTSFDHALQLPIQPQTSRYVAIHDLKTYVELGVALGSLLKSLFAGLPLLGALHGSGGPAADHGGRAKAGGGAESGATDDARHGGRN